MSWYAAKQLGSTVWSILLFAVVVELACLAPVGAEGEKGESTHEVFNWEDDSSGNHTPVLDVTTGTFIGRKTERRIYTLVDHFVRGAVYLALSAMFAGLTIGIMCMDMLTLGIIASSGQERDRMYASQILPLRRQGHVTLCTLVISNMLMNVLVVQEIASITALFCRLSPSESLCGVNNTNTDFLSFFISTVAILIFTEIIPMSVCKSKYSLPIAAAGCSVVRVAMILVYPVARPMGMLLDWLLPHGAGQIYDRNELRKLMILHCEAHGERSGLRTSELNLLIAAMDFQERKVCDIMKPIENITYVSADEVITAKVIEKLWQSCRSRIPVRLPDGRFKDVLIAKDLLAMPLTCADSKPITIGEFVEAKSRVSITVSEDMSLPSVLKVFQRAKTQMVFVARAEDIPLNEEGGTAPEALGHCTVFEGSPIVGIVTLEDVLETLIKAEIYDEYDCSNLSMANRDCGMTQINVSFTNFPPPQPEPAQIPRVSFYSYGVYANKNVPLTEDQVWAAAYYLTRAVPAFYLWHPGYVKMLLDECGDRKLFPPHCPEGCSRDVAGRPGSSGGVGGSATEQTYNISYESDCIPGLYPPAEEGVNSSKYDSGRRLVDSFVLYRDGEQSSVFTLVLGGTVDVVLDSGSFMLRRQPFEWLGEAALKSHAYVPDFDAFVRVPTRIYSIPRLLYEKYLTFNNRYARGADPALVSARPHRTPSKVGKIFSAPPTSLNMSFSEHPLVTERDNGDPFDGVEMQASKSVNDLYGTF